MIRIRIEELEKHRSETTFRPYLMAQEYFRDIGVHLNYRGDSYDYVWVSQASFSDKKVSLQEANKKGIKFLKSIGGECWLFDGQDSASLIGSYDVFLKSPNAKYLFKNTLYRDEKEYSLPWVNGRSYWGMSAVNGYRINDFSRFKDIRLSGCNWLSTVSPNWFQYKGADKPIDVFAVFSYPAKENYEFGIKTSIEYDLHRVRCIESIKKLPRKYNVKMLVNGEHIPRDQYYKAMAESKIIIAPFGYGEIAPRDIESAMVGAVLIKPDMNHIATIPNVYAPEVTYKNVQWNFEDLNESIIHILEDWPRSQEHYVENMRREYSEQYATVNLVEYMYNIFKEEPNIIGDVN